MKKKLIILLFLFTCCVAFEVKQISDYCLLYSRYLYLITQDKACHLDEASKFYEQNNLFIVEHFLCFFGLKLFYEKYDSLLVKELLLLCKDDDFFWSFRTVLLDILSKYFNVSWLNYTVVFNLNLYRLGFIKEHDLRICIWLLMRKAILKIPNENAFSFKLLELVTKYCEIYKCDEFDKQHFNELLAYKWDERDLRYTSFDKYSK